MNFEVTAIIPALNSANTITRAIQSVLDQTLEVSEIIIVDNGSTDDTINLALKTNTKKIKLLNCKLRGAASARNMGIAASRTEWIAFLDSDDYWDTQKLQKQFEYLDQLVEKDKVSLIFTRKSSGNHCGGKTGKLAIIDLLVGNHITTSSVIVKRDALISAAGQAPFNTNVNFGEDWLLWLKIATTGEIHLLDHGLVNYTNSPIEKYNWKTIEFSLNLLLADFLECGELHVLQNEWPTIKRTASHSIYIHLLKYALQLKQYKACARYLLLAFLSFSPQWYIAKLMKIKAII